MAVPQYDSEIFNQGGGMNHRKQNITCDLIKNEYVLLVKYFKISKLIQIRELPMVDLYFLSQIKLELYMQELFITDNQSK